MLARRGFRFLSAANVSETLAHSVCGVSGHWWLREVVDSRRRFILPYNIPKIAEFCFDVIDPSYAKRAKNVRCHVVVAGRNYGQGSLVASMQPSARGSSGFAPLSPRVSRASTRRT